MNQLGELPAAKADSKEEAKVGLFTMLETKSDGAAVWSAESTGDVGSAEASWFARGPRRRRTAGSVGREVIPAREALGGEGISWGCEGEGA